MKKALVLVTFLLWIIAGKSSHFRGGNLEYSCLGGNQYRVILHLYFPCIGGPYPAPAYLNVTGNCGSFTQLMTQVYNGQVNVYYPVNFSPCPNLNGITTFSEVIFEDTISLAPNCIYTISFMECCRPASSNVNNSAGMDFVARNYINTAYCNNSPKFHHEPPFLICTNQPTVRSVGAYDPDGDSVVYVFDTISGNSPAIPFYPGYSLSSPMGSGWQVSLDPESGDVFFNPNPGSIGNYEICVRMLEYRNGVLLSNTDRSFEVTTVGSCQANQAASLPVINPVPSGFQQIGDTLFPGCHLTTGCMDFQVTDPNPGDSLVLSWDQHLPGSTFYNPLNPLQTNAVYGTGTVTGRLCWNLPQPGIYAFRLFFSDQHGTLYTQNDRIFYINTMNNPGSVSVNPPGPIMTCRPDTGISFSVIGTFPHYLWSNSDTAVSTVYSTAGNFWVRGIDSSGCPTIVAPFQIIGPEFDSIDIQPDPFSFCAGGNNILSATPGFQSYLWSTGSTNDSISLGSTGSYSVSGTDSRGCTQSDTTVVNAGNQLNISLSPGPVIVTHCASNNHLVIHATPGFQSYQWLRNNIPTPLSLNVDSLVWTGLTTGTMTFSVIVTNGVCTDTSAPVTVTYQSTSAPAISPAGPIHLCTGSTVTLQAPFGYSNYHWSSGASTTNTMLVNTPGSYRWYYTDSFNCNVYSPYVQVLGPTVPVIAASQPNPLCTGASVTLSTTTGFTSYNWSQGGTGSSITVSSPGNYSVTTVDSFGCTASSAVYQVVQALQYNLAITPAGPLSLCPGSSITLTASAGFTNYQWSPSGTGQTRIVSSPGTYTVTATNPAGCPEISNTVTVQSGSPLPLSITPSNPVMCPGGSVTLTASNGFTNYVWNPSGTTGNTVSANSTGNWSVTATGPNGCQSSSAPVTVSLSNLNLTLSPPGSTQFCQGNSVLLTTSGGFSNFQWHPQGSGGSCTASTPGNYYVVATDSFGCTDTSNTVTLSYFPPAGIAFTYIQHGDTVWFTATPPGLTYVWDFGDSTTSSLANPMHVYPGPGNYAVLLSSLDSNGCKDSTLQNLSIIVAVSEQALQGKLYYADPVLFLQTPAAVEVALSVYDNQGRMVWSPEKSIAAGTISWNMPVWLSSGIYFTVVQAGEDVYRLKILKN